MTSPPSPVTQSHPSCTQRSLCTAQDSEGDNGEPGSGDVTKFTPGCGSGNWYTRAKKTLYSPCRSQALPRAAPQPRGEAGELWVLSGALPHTHSQGSPEVQVQEVLHLMGDLEPKALADHHMPGGAELLVHCLLDHLCSTLEGKVPVRGSDRYKPVPTPGRRSLALSSTQKMAAAPACSISTDGPGQHLLQGYDMGTAPGHLIRKELGPAGRNGGLRKPGLRAGCITLGSRPAPTSSAVNQ